MPRYEIEHRIYNNVLADYYVVTARSKAEAKAKAIRKHDSDRVEVFSI
jgi:hypothetical protein|tara:strand:+ start:7046 stop:7189 length:144 start_codon:yes stop_codon:yes gene_type:complete